MEGRSQHEKATPMTRRIVLSEDLQAIGTVADWEAGPYKRKPDGKWRVEVTIKDPTMQGTPHGSDEPEVSLYPLSDDRELDDPPVFTVRELVELLDPYVQVTAL
jgi:hypothetical protein